jgi:hypothetical protein
MEPSFSSFDKDKFQRKPFADRLTRAITCFSPLVDGAYVLSLNACFGSGKTTFFNMWKDELETNQHKVIYLNAWDTDFDEDPVMAILHSLLENIESNNTVEVSKALKAGLVVAASSLVNQIIKQSTRGIVDVQEIVEKTKIHLEETDSQSIGNKIYEAYGFKRKAYQDIKTALEQYVKTLEKKPLIIMIDELDRVRPDYAVKFLEAIKHIFSVTGICFVLAVDRGQLECSVKQLYGNLDFDNYYRRFISREAALPVPDHVELKPFIEQILEDYFAKLPDHIRTCFYGMNDKHQRERLSHAQKVCHGFRLTPRQIENVLRIFIHHLLVEENKMVGNSTWLDATLFLIALGVSDRQKYQHLGEGKAFVKDMYDYLSDLSFDKNNGKLDYYIAITVLSAFNLRQNDRKNDEQTAALYKSIIDHNKDFGTPHIINILAEIVEFAQRIPEESGFQRIYKKLEEWRPFVEF